MASKNNLPGQDKDVSLMDKSDFKSLEEFFNAEKKNIQKAKELRLQMAKEIAEVQQREMLQAIREWVKEEEALKEVSAERIAKHQKELLEKRAEEEFRKKLEIQNKIYQKELEDLKSFTEKTTTKQAVQNKEGNKETLKLYDIIEKNGENLTEEQKKDREEKKKQIDIANKALIQQTLMNAGIKALQGTMTQTLNAVNNGINTYAKYQGGINARLQGSNLGNFVGTGVGGDKIGAMALSYILSGGGGGIGGGAFDVVTERLKYGTNTFGILENRLSTAVGIQPYVKTESLLNNLNDLVKTGIAANVEQRAFLQTVKENIADTFDAANASLLRIIRLQQSDSTSTRLGMEAYLTRFLNRVTESTEYLNQTFDNVQDALLEASSQMTADASTEFEYIVQKWLGALSGTGLSDSTATGLAQAIGYLGSGNVSAFGESSMQGLLTMAASRSGLDIGSILNNGLNAATTNALLNAVANYMVEIGGNRSNVVRSQLAQTFGLNISDITAAQQLAGNFNYINNDMLTTGGMYGALVNQMLALPTRMSMSEMIQNTFDNTMFSFAAGIAENPVLASLWKVTDMIESTTGGINIPFIEAMGTGFDLNATVEQLMKLGIVGISSLGMIGDVISGISSSVLPSSMLWKLGIFGNTSLVRGGGISSAISGLSTSQSAVIANNAGGDYYEQSLQKGADSANNNETVKPQVDEEETEALPNIYKYLNETFDPKFDRLISAVNELRDTVVNGEIEVKDINHNAFNI